ncbi:uncharacterized protein LOC121519654 [Cheilinus undulatus]|uniref:uncharacterized protein LOC121519654 n=1 Tax=Cheilinus undulatus TaxID=241271 RepID=UPI001BD3424F|nr:uncharacterized protein LOC121519654 [Cheilinus undulatus]
MHFLGILLLMLGDITLGVSLPVDTVIVQVQQRGVVGSHQVMEQVLLNGVSLTGTSQEVGRIIRTISAGALFPAFVNNNQTSVLRNHTLLRSRECILEGSQLHWTDRVFCDGALCLTLDHSDAWRAQIPQALTLKLMLDQEAERTRMERIRLQQGCIELMKELRLSRDRTDSGIPLPQFLIPVLALLAFAGLIIISLLLSKNYGLRHPGGVIGSVIHYPQDMAEMPPEKKAGYYSL